MTQSSIEPKIKCTSQILLLLLQQTKKELKKTKNIYNFIMLQNI